jgi:hypothetical protein
MFAMVNDERSVNPYLLWPLRTLEEVLGGRGRMVEAARGGVEATPTGGDQSVRSKIAADNHRSVPHGAAD